MPLPHPRLLPLRSRLLPLGAALFGASLIISLAPVPDASADAAESAFRVNPYLQNPTPESMTLTWFSAEEEAGWVTVRGPGRPGTKVRTIPSEQDILDYTDAERTQEIDGLEQGSWLQSGGNYKHTITLDDLEPDSTYRYRVDQGDDKFTAEFRTAPSKDDWESIRFVALSDSETEPLGQVQKREWAPGAGSNRRPAANEGGAWDQVHGTAEFSGSQVLRYPLTESEGFERNLSVINERDPNFVMFTGDLVQGGGYQPGWDEFFRLTNGEDGSGLSHTPILPALGNWESFGALNGGYGTPEDRSPVVRSRAKYHSYFDSPDNGTAAHRDNYYRLDYGPVTVLTLDGNNGEPDDAPENYADEDKATGQEYRGPGTDTQDNFTRAEYEAAGGTDLSDFNPGSAQWNWAERNLRQARAQGQIVFVQFHHAPFSSGEHGLPMDHEQSSGQGATPMRQYHAMFEQYGVSAVISGHSELAERSFVDSDSDGVGVNYYDVGIAGDGLRGERRTGDSLDDPLLRYDPYRQWTADQDANERWRPNRGGTFTLTEGGKHYGHLEVNVTKKGEGATVTLTPVHNFPVLNADYTLDHTERRAYDDEITLTLDRRGRVIND